MVRSSGQASIEYAGALLLVSLVLAGAATAVAAPDVAEAVVRKLRHGLCIVGADVCTPADARERGLEACPVEAVASDLDAGPTVLLVRVGGQNGTEIAERSDGTYEYSRYWGVSVDATAGAGLQLGPVVQVGAGASAGLVFRSGEAWLLDGDEQALIDFERRDDRPEPQVRYLEGGGRAEVAAALGIGDDQRETAVANGSLGVRQALGRRTGPGHTTWYFEHAGEASADIGQSLGLFDAGARRVVEWRASDPPVITVREAKTRGPRVVEKVARMTLDDPADRASARRWAVAQAAPPLAALWAADFARRLRQRGTLERFTFDEVAKRSGWNFGVGAGAKVGADKTRVERHRRLVAAEVLGGPVPGRRDDCFVRH